MVSTAPIEAADYWNAHLEYNALRAPPSGKGPDTNAGAFLAWCLEAAGDIIRETSKEQRFIDPHYVSEKYHRLLNNLHLRDWKDPLSPRETSALVKIREDIEGLPANTDLLKKAKATLQAIAERNLNLLKIHLEDLRPLLEMEISRRLPAVYPKPYPEILKQFPWGEVPEKMKIGGKIGQLEIEIPPIKGTPIPPKKVRVKPDTPRVLTMEDYERDWKPKGWRLLTIGPTATWRQDWGPWQAIRDIVQNSLDEAEAYQWGYDDQGLWLADEGRGVGIADFLLGPPKLKPSYARGRFGEGMKIGALALLRDGYSMHIETVGRELWIIFLEQEVNGKALTLAALWREDGTSKGTRFHIIGYTGDSFADGFAVNLDRSAILWEGPSLVTEPVQRYNQLIQRPAGGWPGGQGKDESRIFARDIYMQQINSPFSYNLWSFNLAPDRHAPANENDLWIDVGRLWSTVNRADCLKVFLQMVKDPPIIVAEEGRRVNMNYYELGTDPVSGKRYSDLVKDNKETWLEAWKDVMGENAIIRTKDNLDNIVKHLGYQPVSLSYGVRETLSGVIPTDEMIRIQSQERLRETEVVPDDNLDPLALAHLNLARAIARRAFPFGPVSGVYAAIIPAASDRVRTAGMYGTTTQAVFLSLDQLARGRSTLDTLTHELAHHRQYRATGQAEDLTPGHAEAMTYVAASIVELVAAGEFSDLLKEVIWR